MILEEILTNLKNKKEKIAYISNGHSYTYSELYNYVSNIYAYLIENNKEKRPVILYGKKEIYMKAGFLACSFAGMPYVAIDKSTPKSRVSSIIKQINPSTIIDSEKFNTSNLPTYNITKDNFLTPQDIYYIIFTSGSTGEPKGVKVTYENLDTCIKWLKEITQATENDTILNQAIYSFDLSVADLYLSSLCGCAQYALDTTNILDFANIFNQLKQSNATIAVMTPSFAELLLTDKKFCQKLMPNLKTILFCGERLLKQTTQKLYERFPNLKIINSYGPTETTFAVTSINLDKQIANLDNIPVGRPKADVKIYILDDNNSLLPEQKIRSDSNSREKCISRICK